LECARRSRFVSGNLSTTWSFLANATIELAGREARRQGRFAIVVAGSVVATEEPLALIAFGLV